MAKQGAEPAKDARIVCGACLAGTFAVGWLLTTAFAHNALFGALESGADLGARPALVGLALAVAWAWLVCYKFAPRLAGKPSHWAFGLGLAAGVPAASALLLLTTPGGALDGLFSLVFVVLTLGLVPEAAPGSGAALAVAATSMGTLSFVGFVVTGLARE